MQSQILLPILIASITTFVSIYLLRPFAISINLLDSPNSRKRHIGAIPLIGGIAMFIGVIVGILITSNDLNQYKYFLLTSAMIVMLGVLDDHHEISVSLRLFFQTLAAIIIVTVGGLSIESLGNLFGLSEIILDEWSFFLTVLAIITGMNAVNMADGIHGLAGGNSLVTFIAIFFLSFGNYSNSSVLIVLLFCSVIPVFLINNLCIGISKEKRIFMGDAGSMFVGLGIVWVLIELSQGESRMFSPVIALWLFALPLIEIVTATFRRISSGKSPFKSDLYHSHHLLLRLGIGERKTLLIILFVSILMSLIGVLGEIYAIAEWIMFIGFLIISGIYILINKMLLVNINNNGNHDK